MRKNRLVGMAYAKPLAYWGGAEKSPCICAGIHKQISQLQRYPMVIDFYETNSNSNTRKGHKALLPDDGA